ncbi:GTPase family protein [Microbacterium gorillae]|uniref:GTPase family protein n=1 Tax=Microbacterium gorillae TaxID=1231063 RepID=UPI00069467F8|nr:GTPase [Microbacterium gorillae]
MTAQRGEPDQPAQAIDGTPFLEATAEAKARYGRFNLAIVGATGVGKSSLVNAVFGRDLAKVGKGLPVTRGVHYYHDESLGIWDLEGFEIGSASTPAETLRGHLATIASRPASEQIAVVWYCVLSTADRLTPPDIAMIRELDAAGLPVILVLTKVDWTKNPLTGKYSAPKDVEEFRDWLEHPVDADGRPVDLRVQGVVLTAAYNKHGKGAGHGLGELVTQTLALSPENEKDAFRIAQRLNLPWKREMARPVISAAASAAAAAAAVPIPVADAVVLAPIQISMMGRIAAIYDLELKTMMSAGALAQLGVQMSGQALARSFLKLIPGAGSVINAGVALAVTAATGEAWMRLCEAVHTGKIDVSKIGQTWSSYAPSFVDVVRKIADNRRSRPGH